MENLNDQPQKYEKEGDECDPSDWILDIKVMLGCLRDSEVKACSISRVSDNLRKSNEDAFTPKVVSIGPFHKTTCHPQSLEEISKWRYMHALLHRAQTQLLGSKDKLDNCIKAIQKKGTLVRASYAGGIRLKPHELARMMLLDGCFLLEFLLRLYDSVTGDPPYMADVEDNDNNNNNNNKILRVLIDLTLLENQIPFIVVRTLASELCEGDTGYSFPTLEELAKCLFDYNVNSLTGVCHFLHLMQLSSFVDYDDKETGNPYGCNETSKEATQELKRCATKLQAFGIKILLNDTKKSGASSALSKFTDKFDMNIEFNESKVELKIPPLHIKEATEVKWRNLIAWEQSTGIGTAYKFTSYALFFKGLICSVHDIELLKAKNVIIVDEHMKIRNDDLLDLFGSITTGVEQMDCRYSALCVRLNSMKVGFGWMKPQKQRIMLMVRHYCSHVPAWLLYVLWRYWRCVVAWLRCEMKIWIVIFIKEYIPNPWAFIGILAATVLLVLTIMQTYYAALGN